MRFLLLFLAILSSLSISSQRNITPTDTLYIRGKIQSEKKFSLSQLDSFPKITLQDLVLYNQKGEVKDSIKSLKGILLKTLLAKTELVYEKPKELNEFCFVLTSSDSYKVVLSWNEIYNTTIGDQFFIITEMEGKPIREMEERILFLSAGDLKTGRRYVRGLDHIDVKRVN